MNFQQLPLEQPILKALEEMGFSEPTQIQEKAIPVILEGKDVIGRSSTGTGKTAAFAVPATQIAVTEGVKNTILILSPTRELSIQISDQIKKICRHLPKIGIATLFGGQEMRRQFEQLRKSHIVVGTPGRVMDHLRRKTLKLQNLKMIILDEADEMLNMGFIEDIRTILESAPEERQTVLFSATMSKAIMKITEDFQTDPVLVAVDGGKRTVDHIDQQYFNIPRGTKNDTLKLLWEYHKPKRALIFCNTKKMVDELCEEMQAEGYRSVAIHGDLKQSQRTQVMKEFKTGRANILIATDVAARGIDVDDVEAVFNYDLPTETEYYIHRIGRTGRAGRQGASYSLVANKSDLKRLQEIERYIKVDIEPKAVPTVEDIAAQNTDSMQTELLEKVASQDGSEWLWLIDNLIEEGVDLRELSAALCAKVLKKNKRLANVRNVNAIVKGKPQRAQAASGKQWVRVNIGSGAKIAPNFIVGAITEETGLPAGEIGKINIYQEYSEIELSAENAAIVVDLMQDTKIKKRPVSFTAVEAGAHRGDKKHGKKHGERRSHYGDKRHGDKRHGGDRHHRSDRDRDRDRGGRSDRRHEFEKYDKKKGKKRHNG